MSYKIIFILTFFKSISSLIYFDPNEYHQQFSNNLDEFTFDFIIVGGGTAGCTLASRLSENGLHSVLLIESGGFPHPQLDIPALSAYLVGTSNYTVSYRVPDENAGLRTGGVVYHRGRVLGGGSQVNYLFFNRGSPFDYDNWANLTGDGSWSYRNLLKYFKKAEDYLGIFPSDQHGSGGAISVEKPSYAPGVDEFIKAGVSLGYAAADPNGPQIVGFTPGEFSSRNGRRISSYTGYLKPVLGRKNLALILEADVEEIEFEGNRAIGIWYKLSGESYQFIRCRKEVIISAGAIGSPILLQKSGIGPAEVLSKAGILAKKVLPVGENLMNHAVVRLEFIVDKQLPVFSEDQLTSENYQLYQKEGTGPYVSTHGFDGQAFISSSFQLKSANPAWPDIQYHYLGSSRIPNGFDPIFRPHLRSSEAVVSLGFNGGRPKSKGFVRLNPFHRNGEPEINFRYFSEKYDLDVAIEGIRWMIWLFTEAPIYKKVNARLPPMALPECQHLDFGGDEYWTCYIRYVSGAEFHGAGTCRMGQEGDERAVVDSQLKVIGIEGLRVVDASIMPEITNANLQAAVYGIAEKASDMILKEWQKIQI